MICDKTLSQYKVTQNFHSLPVFFSAIDFQFRTELILSHEVEEYFRTLNSEHNI